MKKINKKLKINDPVAEFRGILHFWNKESARWVSS